MTISTATTRPTLLRGCISWWDGCPWVDNAALLVVAATWRPVVLVIPAWVLGASIAVLSSRPASGGVVDA